jgi:hypothetical protein
MLRRLPATCALALGLLGLGAAPASAGQSQTIETERGSVTFEHHGEILRAYPGPCWVWLHWVSLRGVA